VILKTNANSTLLYLLRLQLWRSGAEFVASRSPLGRAYDLDRQIVVQLAGAEGIWIFFFFFFLEFADQRLRCVHFANQDG